MARKPWLHCVAGTTLFLTLGCYTPPTHTGIQPPRFPTGPGNQTTNPSQTNGRQQLPSPQFPSSPQIGAPSGQGSATNAPARLRPMDPSAANPAGDWQAGGAPMGGTPPALRPAGGEISPPPPLTSPPASVNTLQNRMPMGSPPFTQPGPLAPQFPTQTPLPAQSLDNQYPAGAFPTPSTPNAPGLNTRMSPYPMPGQ